MSNRSLHTGLLLLSSVVLAIVCRTDAVATSRQQLRTKRSLEESNDHHPVPNFDRTPVDNTVVGGSKVSSKSSIVDCTVECSYEAKIPSQSSNHILIFLWYFVGGEFPFFVHFSDGSCGGSLVRQTRLNYIGMPTSIVPNTQFLTTMITITIIDIGKSRLDGGSLSLWTQHQSSRGEQVGDHGWDVCQC